jgi:hypothetical protein
VSVVSGSYEPHVEGRDTMNLTCLVEANPPAEIAWRRTGDSPAVVVATGRSLVLGPVNRADAGTYSCRATNPLGESEPAEQEIVVHCK